MSGKGTLRILPLGGLGEIGKNMCVVEYDGKFIMVDAGLRFPTPEMLGIDLVLPDFSYVIGRDDDFEAVFLTHGHEDHVGALPFLLREVSPKAIYTGGLTAALVRSKLDEHRLKDVPVEVVDPGRRVEAGPFEVEMVHVSHSIPDSRAVVIRSPRGTVVFTGDYKFDQTPVDGKPADITRLAELGDEGVLLLCGDSTNADREGVSLSESQVGPVLEDLFAKVDGRVIVTSFASNIHRMQQVVDAGWANGRKLALVGRSMRKNMNIARSLGHAQIPEGMLIQPEEISDFPDHRVVVLCTGSQGEPLSALRRMSHEEHPQLEIHSGDTVVFSATPVPGNERAVSETIDRLYDIGARVITAQDIPVHASGHGWREELKLMLNLTRPRYVMPVHGDYKRIHLHSELAMSVGVEKDAVFKGRNGLPLDIDEQGPKFGKKVRSGVMYVDGLKVGDVDDVALRDRRMLSGDGIFIVVATVSAEDGSSVSPPELIFRGVPFMSEADDLLDELRAEVEISVEEAAKEGVTEIDALQEWIHDDIAKLVYRRLKRRPMVLPVVVEV